MPGFIHAFLRTRTPDAFHSCIYCFQALEEFKRLPPSHFCTGWVLHQVGRAYFERTDYANAKVRSDFTSAFIFYVSGCFEQQTSVPRKPIVESYTCLSISVWSKKNDKLSLRVLTKLIKLLGFVCGGRRGFKYVVITLLYAGGRLRARCIDYVSGLFSTSSCRYKYC